MVAEATLLAGTVQFYVRAIVFKSLFDQMLINRWQLTVSEVAKYDNVLTRINEDIRIDFERGSGVFNLELKPVLL